ncbi:Transposon Ty3-G Gag-Pol polyprotein [Gossypium australe]|uniref:Transposon Ty3-G Gag-Pol polyprotein n=1 Tax=Gossypium australe TaxID=47621 RepID=A0A5B6VAK8_9ROSI|nr:Transposon Ty3-G Gag-Pol polyprotein [Gossypium australe]
MTTIFADMLKDGLDIFMDNFSCLGNLEWYLERCEYTNLVLNWEKCHFMGLFSDIKFLRKDKAKIEVIEKLPHPTNVRGVQNFLGHVDFYKRFIKYFAQVSKPFS